MYFFHLYYMIKHISHGNAYLKGYKWFRYYYKYLKVLILILSLNYQADLLSTVTSNKTLTSFHFLSPEECVTYLLFITILTT